jgi:hypothetical protein
MGAEEGAVLWLMLSWEGKHERLREEHPRVERRW